jgi:hypothetical protein
MGDNFKRPEGNINNGAISMDESLSNCLLYFEETVLLMSGNAEELFGSFGEHPGVGGEVKQEILAGRPLITWNKIPETKRGLIEKIIMAADDLPDEALDGNLDGLNHPAWNSVRDAVSEYLRDSKGYSAKSN